MRRTVEAQEAWPVRLRTILAAGSATVIVVTLALGLVLSRIAVVPLEKLMALVRNSRGESLRLQVRGAGFRDEIDDLARALGDASARSEAFLDREQNFTRNVSHELRTPLSVIRGAVELLLSKAGVASSNEGQRNEGGVTGEALLESTAHRAGWSPRPKPCSGSPASEARTRRRANRGLAWSQTLSATCSSSMSRRQSVSVSGSRVRSSAVLVAPAPASVLRVALDNLVRNAIDSVPGGVVEVRSEIDDDSLLLIIDDRRSPRDAARAEAGSAPQPEAEFRPRASVCRSSMSSASALGGGSSER